MLQNLSDQIRDCLRRATDSRKSCIIDHRIEAPEILLLLRCMFGRHTDFRPLTEQAGHHRRAKNRWTSGG